mmetsp:Transcript_57321/g.100403  ORF Transcript_57321/g.100403 Transcript_57321/m.100403 type:complete len:307 (-) Transcript_57321:115-1035(-)
MSVPYGPSYWDEEEEVPNYQEFSNRPVSQQIINKGPQKRYTTYDAVKPFVENLPTAAISTFFTDNYATSLFLITFTLFATPLRLTMAICNNVQVTYWIARDFGLYILILPASYVAVFLWHTCSRAPSKFLTIITTVGSCIFFLIVCDLVLVNSLYLGEALTIGDCDTFPGKRIVQAEWEAARSFYATCAAKKATNSSMDFVAAVAVNRIQDCPGYEQQLLVHPAWAYLGDMEETMGCSGWCQRDFAIWTRRRDLKDSCSVVAAQVFTEVIQNTMKQVVFYIVGVLLIVAVLLFMVGPVLRSQGVSW